MSSTVAKNNSAAPTDDDFSANAFGLSATDSPFLSEVFFGNAVQESYAFIVERLASHTDENAVVLSYDCGFLAFGARLKNALKAAPCGRSTALFGDASSSELACGISSNSIYERTSFFSVDDNELDGIGRLVRSIENVGAFVAIGDSELAIEVLGELIKTGYSGEVLVLPTDYSVADAEVYRLSKNLGCVKFFYDDAFFYFLKKGKTADAVRSVFSKRIAFIEMRVNELIGGDFDFSTAKRLLNESVKECLNFLKDYDYKRLVFAKTLSAEAVCDLPFGDDTAAVSKVLKAYGLRTESGEREYLAYKILLKLYSVAIASDVCAVKVPSFVLGREELKSLLPSAAICEPPECYPLNAEREFERVRKDEKIVDCVLRFNAEVPRLERVVYLVYGGRKRAEEEYPQNVLLQAVKSAPLLSRGVTLLKLIWADGFLELI